MSSATTSSGFLRKDLLTALSTSIASVTESNFNEKADYICSVILELLQPTKTAVCTLISSIIEAYSNALVTTAPPNLWATRAIDEIINDIPIIQQEKEVSVRLLCKLAMITTRDIARQKAVGIVIPPITPRTPLYPTDLIIDIHNLIHLKCDININTTTFDADSIMLRDAILRTFLTSLVHDNLEDAQTLIKMIMTRCGRTKCAYDEMHQHLMSDIGEDDERIWMSLGFTISNSAPETKKKTNQQKTDAAWGLWRTMYKYTDDEDARDFVARLASLYTYKWTPARRHLNTNLMMYALHVVMSRCSIEQDIFEPDFMDLVQVSEIRMIQQLSSSSS
jgi:hypothetical protein